MTVLYRFCLLAAVLTGCAKFPATPQRPESWASQVPVEGLENLHRVSPDLYRSEQPSEEGLENLEELGIKTVVNLRAFHSNEDELAGTDLDRANIPVQTWDPDENELLRFLKLATDPDRTPVLVHCWHGSDRTGAMCAAYRVVVQGWPKEEAIREMRQGGFGHHKIWSSLAEWIHELKVGPLRERLRETTGVALNAAKPLPRP